VGKGPDELIFVWRADFRDLSVWGDEVSAPDSDLGLPLGEGIDLSSSSRSGLISGLSTSDRGEDSISRLMGVAP
jgi:hypothetical protein